MALRVIELWAVVNRDAEWRAAWNAARDALVRERGSVDAAWRAMRRAG